VLVHGPLRELASSTPRRVRRGRREHHGLSAFESPAAFSRSCLRLAALIAVVGVLGVLDRLFALCLVLLLCLFGGLARLVSLDLDEDEPEVLALLAPVGSEPSPATLRRTFRLPAAVGARTVHLVGDVNGWSRAATPMRRDGAWFTVDVDLEPGRSYRYRYLLDGERWENDWSADAYVPNGFGSDDSVVRT
jgi:hypothetical protein